MVAAIAAMAAAMVAAMAAAMAAVAVWHGCGGRVARADLDGEGRTSAVAGW